jgi:hypothetical protein
VPAPWEAFADALLMRQALLVRMAQGRPPDDFAGLYVGDDDVDRLIAALPGFAVAAPDAGDLGKELDQVVDEARVDLHRSLGDDAVFATIARHARLAAAEVEVLALAAATELDLRRQRLVGYVQDNVALTRLTLAAVGEVFPAPHPGVLSVAPDARLQRAALLRLEGSGSWAAQAVVVAPAVAWALVGDRSLEQDLAGPVEVLEAIGADGPAASLVLVHGDDRTRRLDLVAEEAAAPSLLVSPVPADATGWAALVRQATLTGKGIVLDLVGELPDDARQWVERADHLSWVISSRRPLPLESLPRLPWVERSADSAPAGMHEWRRCGVAEPEGHRLTPDQVALVATAAHGLGGDVPAAVRRLAGGHLDGRAVHIRPRRGWNDLVLGPDQLAQLQELTSRYRHRHTVHRTWDFPAVPSAGLVALFAGPSGTGKTLAAEVVAGDLGLDLYKIDLSSVVSKYIGETEKHLEALFDAAAAGNVVLFFDEADALFGRRSEVSDAHDRYANIEVSYLLQRIERYDGLLVLATNLQNNIDAAFVRRIHIAVDFCVPDEAERRALWQLSFPPQAPTLDLDLDFLARQFKLAGGAIHNVALHGAFLAAAAGEPITMEKVVLGLKRELHKLGRLCTQSEFAHYYDLVQ